MCRKHVDAKDNAIFASQNILSSLSIPLINQSYSKFNHNQVWRDHIDDNYNSIYVSQNIVSSLSITLINQSHSKFNNNQVH